MIKDSVDYFSVQQVRRLLSVSVKIKTIHGGKFPASADAKIMCLNIRWLSRVSVFSGRHLGDLTPPRFSEKLRELSHLVPKNTRLIHTTVTSKNEIA
jgi:hypothetical protein